jgi:hypothetical protein
MSHYLPTSVHGSNLSEAWARAFLECWSAHGATLASAVVSFNIREDDLDWTLENGSVRAALEGQLQSLGISSVGQSSIETVAGTIFPESIWRRCQGDRNKFYQEYNAIWPRVKRCRQNCHGVYFRRLTAFGEGSNPVNQLEEVISTWNNGVHRHSALQAAVFDPLHDHKPTRQRGFPCLQQVAFHPNETNGRGGLSIVAFYATQLLVEKAYGNYLGLYRLGKFMAKAMGLNLVNVTCIAADLKLNATCTKSTCMTLERALKGLIAV